MTTAITVLVFVAAGIFIFSVVAGAAVFAQMFARKQDDGSLDPEVIKASLGQLRRNRPGAELDGVRMPGNTAPLAAHVNDKKIMVPLLEAKLRWLARLEKAGASGIERIAIRGTYGKRLAGYYSTPGNAPGDSGRQTEAPGCVALLVHGYTDSAAGMAYLAEEYNARGVAVLAVDCRSHGFSEGNAITLGYTDSKDVVLWTGEIVRRFGNVRIILHGVSMGAAAVIQALARRNIQHFAPQIALAVADCGFSSAKAQMTAQSRSLFGVSLFQRLMARLVLSGMSLVNFLICGFFVGRNSPERALRKKRRLPVRDVPVLLFHGTDDAFVPAEMACALKKAGGGHASLCEVDGAPHIGSYFYAPNMYMERIMAAVSGADAESRCEK